MHQLVIKRFQHCLMHGVTMKPRQICYEQMVTGLRLAPGPTRTRNGDIKQITGSSVVTLCNLVDWYQRWRLCLQDRRTPPRDFQYASTKQQGVTYQTTPDLIFTVVTTSNITRYCVKQRTVQNTYNPRSRQLLL